MASTTSKSTTPRKSTRTRKAVETPAPAEVVTPAPAEESKPLVKMEEPNAQDALFLTFIPTVRGGKTVASRGEDGALIIKGGASRTMRHLPGCSHFQWWDGSYSTEWLAITEAEQAVVTKVCQHCHYRAMVRRVTETLDAPFAEERFSPVRPEGQAV